MISPMSRRWQKKIDQEETALLNQYHQYRRNQVNESFVMVTLLICEFLLEMKDVLE